MGMPPPRAHAAFCSSSQIRFRICFWAEKLAAVRIAASERLRDVDSLHAQLHGNQAANHPRALTNCAMWIRFMPNYTSKRTPPMSDWRSSANSIGNCGPLRRRNKLRATPPANGWPTFSGGKPPGGNLKQAFFGEAGFAL